MLGGTFAFWRGGSGSLIDVRKCSWSADLALWDSRRFKIRSRRLRNRVCATSLHVLARPLTRPDLIGTLLASVALFPCRPLRQGASSQGNLCPREWRGISRLESEAFHAYWVWSARNGRQICRPRETSDTMLQFSCRVLGIFQHRLQPVGRIHLTHGRQYVGRIRHEGPKVIC